MLSSRRNRPELPADTATFEGGATMNAHHPCFDPRHAATARRIHLPVAKNCNIQCRFCNRLYDCVNEQRPGVTSVLLAPKQALLYLERMIDAMGDIDVVGIAGPGDAFADPDVTIETLDLVHNKFPSIALCVSTNGLMIANFAAQLAKLGVTHASVTINAVDTTICEQIIDWVHFEKKTLRGKEAAQTLIRRQREAVISLHEAGIIVKVNTIVISGINEAHIASIAAVAKQSGADVHNCMPFMPVAGSQFEKLQAPDHDSMQKARWGASRHLPQVRHCNRCRADAAGILGHDDPAAAAILRDCASLPRDPSQKRPYIAVASREGALVNEHVGKADNFYVYCRADSGIELVDVRPAPPPGGLLERWRNLSRILHDCRILCASQIGEPPKAVLEDEGITVVITEGLISETVSALFEGRSVPRPIFLKPCTGSSQGGGCL